MSFDKIKEIVKMAFKEGSLSIIVFTVCQVVMLNAIKDERTMEVLSIINLIGLVIAIGIILLRIVVNQYCMVRLRIDKLGVQLKVNDYSDLTKDTLMEVVTPIAAEMIKELKDKLLKKDK